MTTATATPTLARSRRNLPTAGALQWATWAVVVTLIVGPFLPLLWASIHDRPLYEPGGVLTLHPYRQLLGDPAFWHAALNTLEYATLTTLMAVVAGSAVAILVARTDLPWRRAFGKLVLLPILLPPLGLILGWVVVWGPGGYLTNLFSQRLHVGTIAIDTIPGMAIVEASRLLPVAFMTCEAALTRSDASLEEAARSAGASPLRALRSVTIPMLRPALLNSATLIFTLAVASLGIPLLLGTSHDIKMISTYLYITWTARYVSVGGRSRRTALLSLRTWRWPLTAAIAFYLLFATVIPVLGLALMSVVYVLTPLIAPWHELTWANWHALTQPDFVRSIKDSAIIALVGAVVTTAVVALATLVAHRSRLPVRRTLPFVMLYPRATPGIIIGIGFFWAYLVTGGIGEELDRAGRSVGASWWTTSRRIVLPLLRPAIFASFVLMFVEILNDYDPALFLVKPGTEVIGTTMLSTFIQGVVGPVAALAMVQIAVTVVVLAVGARIFKLGVGGGHDA